MIDFSYLKHHDFLAGVDEVGRGPLAGPVVAACAMMRPPEKRALQALGEMGVNDSKKLSSQKRQAILRELKITFNLDQEFQILQVKKLNLSIGLCSLSHEIVDEINILQASLRAMGQAFRGIPKSGKGMLLIDGNKKIPDLKHPMEAIIKGDSLSILIGLASVVAKEFRDRLMETQAKLYPGYGLEKNAGYPTKFHRAAIESLGPSPIHRKTFRGVREYVISECGKRPEI